MKSHLKNFGPGLAVCFAIAIPAWLLGKVFPVVGGAVIAILAGMVITLFWNDKGVCDTGIHWTSKYILQAAVVLLGFGMDLGVILQTGRQSLPIIVCTISTSLILAWLLQKALHIPGKTSILIGVGSSICGGSAIAATAPVIHADDDEVAQSISVIFFFYGLRLNWTKLRQGLSNVKMHAVVLLASFVFFPTLVLAVMTLSGKTPSQDDVAAMQSVAVVVNENRVEPVAEVEDVALDVPSDAPSVGAKKSQELGIWLGIFFLATLPSTVSSSVVMTNIAKGNVPAAIFDASVSSLLGVFITPLWMNIFIDAQSGGRDLGAVLLTLVGQVIIPLTLGVFLNRYWGEFARRHEKKLGRFDQSSIVLIVYVSFCTSFKEKMFSDLSVSSLVKLALGMAALFFAVYLVIYLVCKLLRFNREDMIATLFCGSKKRIWYVAALSIVLLIAIYAYTSVLSR